MADYLKLSRYLDLLGSGAASVGKQLDNISPVMRGNLLAALQDFSNPRSVDAFFTNLQETGSAARRMTNDEVAKIADPARRQEVEALRNISRQDWDVLTGNAMRGTMTRLKSHAGVRDEYERLIIGGAENVDMNAIAAKHGLNTANPNDARFISRQSHIAEQLVINREYEVTNFIAPNLLKSVEDGTNPDFARYYRLEDLPAETLAGMNDAQRSALSQQRLIETARREWVATYSANTPQAEIARSVLTGRMSQEAAKDALEELAKDAREAAAAAARGADNAVDAAAAARAGDNVAATTADAANPGIFARARAGIGNFTTWGRQHPVQATLLTTALPLAIYPGAPMLWNYFRGSSDNNGQNPLRMPSVDSIDSISDSKKESTRNMDRAGKLMEGYNAELTTLEQKIKDIDDAIALQRQSGNAAGVEALTVLRGQVVNVVGGYKANPNTTFPEGEEQIQYVAGLLQATHRDIQSTPDNGSLNVTRQRLAMQQEILMGVHGATETMRGVNSQINDAIAMASSATPQLPPNPLDATILAAREQHRQQEQAELQALEQNRRQLIANAAAPASTLADAHEKAQKISSVPMKSVVAFNSRYKMHKAQLPEVCLPLLPKPSTLRAAITMRQKLLLLQHYSKS